MIKHNYRREYVGNNELNLDKLKSYYRYKKDITKVENQGSYIILYHKISPVNKYTFFERSQTLFDIERLKQIISDLGYGFICYEKYNAFFTRSKQYFDVHGLSLVGKENYENIAFFEYLERILSFNPFNNKLLKPCFNNDYNLIFTDRISKKWTGTEYSNSFERGIEMVSLKNRETLMVPMEYIFYNIQYDKLLDINRGTSNGIALGNSINEATLHALLELYERDTFLSYWYDDYIKVRLIKDLHLNSSIASKIFYYNLQNYDTHFLIFDREPNICVVWCLMISTEDTNEVFSASGVSASIHLDEAISKSFEEATIGLTFLRNIPDVSKKIKEVEKYTYKKLSTQLTINEYIQYYFASYERKEEFRKILKEADDLLYTDIPSSVCDSYEKFLTLMFTIYDDIYFYDMSPSIFNEFGLKCVKVSAVGAKELNFFPVKNLTGKSDYFPLP
ncbi:YcaO-like family protein [Streptococcus acidominimus]